MIFYAVLVVLAVFGRSSMSFGLHPMLENYDDRVINGSTARPGQFPYMVSIRTQFRVNNTPIFRHRCGGSIISDRWVLSAAHCFVRSNPATKRIFVGAHHIFNDGTGYAVNRIVNHPNYNGSSLANDITLFHTSRPIQFNNRVRPIPLRRNFVPAGIAGVASGWGRSWGNSTWSTPTHLQFLAQNTVTNEYCRSRHIPSWSHFITNGTLCAFARKGQGMCSGDSGGPYASNGQLIGIVSWGRHCARGVPDGFVRISAFIDWIREVSGVTAV